MINLLDKEQIKIIANEIISNADESDIKAIKKILKLKTNVLEVSKKYGIETSVMRI